MDHTYTVFMIIALIKYSLNSVFIEVISFQIKQHILQSYKYQLTYFYKYKGCDYMDN